MTTDLARSPNGVLAQYEGEEEEGSLGLAPEDVRPPYVRYNGRDGQFLFTLDGTLSESIRLSVLRKLPGSRLRFNPDATDQRKVLCRSTDLIYPASEEEAAAIDAGPTCAECKYAQFGADRNGNPTKPGCSELLNLAVATDEDPPIPAFLSVKSTGIKPVAAVLSQLEILSRTTKAPAYMRTVEFAAGPPVKEAAKAYVPLVAKVVESVPATRREALSALWRLMRGRADLFQPEEAATSDDEAPAFDEDGFRVASGAELMRQMDEQLPNREEIFRQMDEPIVAAMAAERRLESQSAELTREPADEPEPDYSTADWDAAMAAGTANLPKDDPINARRGRR